MAIFSSKERSTFFQKSGLPFWDAYYEKEKEKIHYPYMLYTSYKESQELIEEIQIASVKVAEVFDSIANKIGEWDHQEFEQWGFDKEYADLLKAPKDKIFCMRIGWAWQGKQLKFFEINSQTPSFWIELESANKLLTKQFGLRDPNPDSNMLLRRSLNQAIEQSIIELPKQRKVAPVIGFVTCNYWEDIDTMRWLSTFCEYEYEVLHIENLDFTREDNIPFNRETGRVIDAIIFWYPLEWLKKLSFKNNERVWDIFIDALIRKTCVMPHVIPAFFLQSKAILAYITENANDIFAGKYSAAKKYFPQTYLSPQKIEQNYIAKPLWGREGRGSFIMKNGIKLTSRYQETYYVNQKKIYQELLTLPQIILEGHLLNIVYESWVYRVGDKFSPGGISLRGSDHVITDDYCYFISLGV